MLFTEFMATVRLQVKDIDAEVRRRQLAHPNQQPLDREEREWWALFMDEMGKRAVRR